MQENDCLSFSQHYFGEINKWVGYYLLGLISIQGKSNFKLLLCFSWDVGGVSVTLDTPEPGCLGEVYLNTKTNTLFYR